MSSYICENQSCNKRGVMRCKTCRIAELPTSFGNYCSSECATVCHKSHKIFHSDSQFEKSNIWIIAIAMKELQLLGKLPSLNSENTFSMLLFGCKEGTECTFDPKLDLIEYKALFNIIKRGIYPEIKHLYILFSGKEMIDNDNIGDDCVTLGFMEALCEDVIAEESLTNTLAILLNPGIQYESWMPAIQGLVEKNLVTIITGKSHLEKLTTDAVHCERILTSYFGANMLINTTKSPARKLDYLIPGVYRNLFYLAFQGRNSDLSSSTLLTSNELTLQNQLAYLEDRVGIARVFEKDEPKALKIRSILLSVRAGTCIELGQSAGMQEVEYFVRSKLMSE